MFRTVFIAIATVFTIASAYSQTLRKDFAQTFKVSKGHTLDVKTQFSNIDILKSKTNDIQIEAYFEIEDIKNTRKVFDDFNIILEQKNDIVSVRTSFPKNMSLKKAEIRIKIFMPEYINLNLYAAYGDVYLSELSGATNNLKISFGQFKADVIASVDNEIKLSYVDNAKVGYIVSGKFDVSFSELEIKKIDLLSIKSKYSEVGVGEVNILDVSSTQFDDWEIGVVNSADIISRYSDIEIDRLSKNLSIDIRFGELEISNTSVNFEQIDVKASYADCELKINPSASYTLRGYGSFADIDVPDQFDGVVNEESNSMEVNGQVGKNPRGKIIITTSFGDIYLNY